MTGVLLDSNTIDKGDIDFTALRNSLPKLNIYKMTDPKDVISRSENAEVVITNKVNINSSHIAALNSTRLICVAATGINNIDVQAATRKGICVTNVTGYATASVVQHTFSLILALVTRYNEYQIAVRTGRWQQSQVFCLLDYPIRELSGKTLGIIGYGVLGKAVAQVAKAFGMKVLVSARKAEIPSGGRTSMEQTLSTSDVISLHCPLTSDTINLIDEPEFHIMKPTAFLINTARGGIINETALLDAVTDGTIAGAGIDVVSEEPPKNGNPLLDAGLPNLIVTPHIAWASLESRQRVVNEVALNIAAFLRGESRNSVNLL